MTQKTDIMPNVMDDLEHGQVVIVTARWILVAAGLILVLWNPAELVQLRVQVTVILLLAFWNFYLHTQLLRRKPPNKWVVYAASIGDITVISVMVITGGGLESGAYIFYFPAILGLAVAFPLVSTILYTGSTLGLYFFIGLFSLALNYDKPGTATFVVLLARLVIIGAIGVCGGLYRRIEHERRRQGIEAQEQLMSKVRGKQPEAS